MMGFEPPGPRASRGAAPGFTLIEVLVALVILEVGLLGCAGVLLLAQRRMATAEQVHRATQAAAGVADSLLHVRGSGGGTQGGDWGVLRWSAAEGAILLRAEDGAGAPLLEWWIPAWGLR